MTTNIIDNNISSLQEKQFAEVVELIIQHKWGHMKKRVAYA